MDPLGWTWGQNKFLPWKKRFEMPTERVGISFCLDDLDVMKWQCYSSKQKLIAKPMIMLHFRQNSNEVGRTSYRWHCKSPNLTSLMIVA